MKAMVMKIKAATKGMNVIHLPDTSKCTSQVSIHTLINKCSTRARMRRGKGLIFFIGWSALAAV